MSAIIDPETLYVDDLPGIWSPVQWELDEPDRVLELEEQAKASLLSVIDVPETILRLLLDETDIERAYEPPEGYDTDIQGEWNESLVTFQFKRPIRLDSVQRERDFLQIVYNFGDRGKWLFEFKPEKVTIEKV